MIVILASPTFIMVYPKFNLTLIKLLLHIYHDLIRFEHIKGSNFNLISAIINCIMY